MPCFSLLQLSTTEYELFSSVADLLKERETTGVLTVRLLNKPRLRRSDHGKKLRYMHLKTGDFSGYLFVKAFDEKVEEMKLQLENVKKPVSLEISGKLSIRAATTGHEHFCPDGALCLSEDTVVKLIDSPVECLDPQRISLATVSELSTYMTRVTITEALVTEMIVLKDKNNEQQAQLALWDASENKCTRLVVSLEDHSTLIHRKSIPFKPFSIEVKEAWVYDFGDGRQLSVDREEYLTIAKVNTLNEKWEKERINPQDAFKIPCRTLQNLSEVASYCEGLRNRDERHFQLNVTIKDVIGIDENDQKFMYKGCTDDRCKKEVNKIKGSYFCPKCKKATKNPKWRYCLKLKLQCNKLQPMEVEEVTQRVDDLSLDFDIVVDTNSSSKNKDTTVEVPKYKELKVTAFDAADDFMEMTAEEIAKCWHEKNGPRDVKKKLSGLLETQWKLRIKVRKDVRNKEYGPFIMVVEEVGDFLGMEHS